MIPRIYTILLLVVACTSEQELVPTCDFDHDTRTYYCTNIYDQFPAQKYGNYHLKCEECLIPIFHNQTFTHYNYLTSFNASNSSITFIMSNAFSHLKNLHYLYLTDNGLLNISKDAFNGLRQVYELHLERNKLAELTPEFLNGFEANAIYLSNNLLKEIPADVFKGIYGSMTLYLSNNKLRTLHANSFNYLNGLEILYLDNNELCHLPLGLFRHVQSLKMLNLSGNKFRKLPPGMFSGLNRLLMLNISRNDLIEFDSSALLPLDNIMNLDLSANGFFYLDYISLATNVPTLKNLGISDNLWSCGILKNIVQHLKQRKINVAEYSMGRFEVPNIHGIACTEKVIQEKISFDHYMKIVEMFKKDYVDYC